MYSSLAIFEKVTPLGGHEDVQLGVAFLIIFATYATYDVLLMTRRRMHEVSCLIGRL